MISIIALWFAAAGLWSDANVTRLSVQPANDRTQILIHVDGDVTWKHTFLKEGNRLVVDLTGAQQALRLDFADINRGGVRGMRISQFQPRVVRVVVDLTQQVAYEVTGANGEVRISFLNPTGSFEAWNTGIGTSPAANADRPASVEAMEKAASTRRAPASARAAEEPPITISIIDQPLVDVLAGFAEFSRRSIIPAPEIANRIINAEVMNKPWDQALEAILSAHGMTIRENEAGILIVEGLATIQQRQATEPTITRKFDIKFMPADSLRTAITALLTPGRGTVAVASAGNSLLITDTRAAIDRITPVIQELDVRRPQVSIQSKIVFVDRTALEDLGFVYDLKDSRGNQLNQVIGGFVDDNNNGVLEPSERTDENVVLLGGNSVAALANANYRVASPALQMITSLVLGRHSLFTFIEALQSVSVSDVQAMPVIQVLNNVEARIQVGERTPIRTIDAGSAGGGQAPQAAVRMEQTGIILRVTPTITGNQVLLDIHAERSNLGLAPSDIGAVFNTQEADTQVLVDNGETAVIAGLTLIEKLKVRAGIPFLMDLPVLGALFRQESEREQKRDLLIMVTPHIVRDGGQ